MDGITDSADAGSSFVSPRQQLLNVKWCAPRTVLIADAVRATLLVQMLTQQLSGPRIEASQCVNFAASASEIRPGLRTLISGEPAPWTMRNMILAQPCSS